MYFNHITVMLVYLKVKVANMCYEGGQYIICNSRYFFYIRVDLLRIIDQCIFANRNNFKYRHLSEKKYLDDVISQVGIIGKEYLNLKKQTWVYRSLVILFWIVLILTVSASGSIKDIEDSSPLSNTDTVFSSSPSEKRKWRNHQYYFPCWVVHKLV